MKESKLLEIAGIFSGHIMDGRPEEARAFLRKNPRAIKAIQRYYDALKECAETDTNFAAWKAHAGIAYEIVTGVMDESKKPAIPQIAPSAEQSAAVYATDPFAHIGHGKTRVQHPL